MDLPTIPTYGPGIVTQQQRNIFPVVPHANQEFYRSIQKGHPKVLGIVQIVLVSLQVTLGAILTTSLQFYHLVTALSGINYWGSLLYLASGAMALLTELKPSRFLVKVLLGSNIASCLTSFIEFCLICKDIDTHSYMFCYDCDFIYQVKNISFGFLFIATMVQLSISVFLAIISWKTLKHNFEVTSQVYDVNNEYRYVMSSGASQT